MNMATTTPNPTTLNEKLVNSSFKVTKILFDDSNGDLEIFVNKLLAEKNENKENAFAILVGLSKTGLLNVEQLILCLGRISPAEKLKLNKLVESYLQSNPDDASCVTLMDAVKDTAPELIADVIFAKKDWPKKEIRRHLSKYLYSEKLWLRLEEMEEELHSRK